MSHILDELFQVIEERRKGLYGQNNPLPGSYTAHLLEKGENEILKKLGEETVEVIVAAKNESDERVIYELADLIYHSMVLLAVRGQQWSDVEAELARRRK